MNALSEKYIDLITSEHRNKPKFRHTVALSVDIFAELTALIATFPQAYDLDNAIGAQLDVDGQWIGQSRKIPEPVADPWFRWGDVLRGWGNSYWYNPAYSQVDYLVALDDVTYKRLLRAKILANHWDGTRPGAEAILNTYFVNPATLLWVQDNSYAATTQNFFAWGASNLAQGWGSGVLYEPGDTVSSLAKTDMSMTIGVAGQWPDVVDLEILSQELLPVKPGGVALDVAVASVNGAPLFGWGVENDFISGWGTGALGVSPTDLVSSQLNG